MYCCYLAGGALVEDDGGLFHLFYTEWLNNCPMRYSTFSTSTHIAHATSETPTGPVYSSR